MNIEPTLIPLGYYYTVQQAAQVRRVARQTVQNWIAQGWLATIQVEGLGHLISAELVKTFVPPKQGPKPVGAAGLERNRTIP